MKDRNSILKTICLILLPVVLICMFVSTIGIIYAIEYPEAKTQKLFYDTESFSNTYKSNIIDSVNSIKNITKVEKYETTDGDYGTILINSEKLETEDGTIYYSSRTNYNLQGFQFLIVDENKKEAYTNISQTIKTDTIAELKEYIKTNTKYWMLENENVITNIDNLTLDNLQYDKHYKYIVEKLEGQKLYTGFNENVDYNDNIAIQKTMFNFVSKVQDKMYVVLPISIVLAIFMIIYLIINAGHIQDKEGITLNWVDKIPLEILGIFSIAIVSIELLLIVGACQIYIKDITLSIELITVAIYFLILTCIYVCGSIIKRIKAKQLFKNSIVYKLYAWVKSKIKNMYSSIAYNLNSSLRIALYLGGFILISLILCTMVLSGGGFFAFVLLMLFWRMDV